MKPRLQTVEFHTGRYLTGRDVKKTHEEGDVHHDDLAKDNPSMGKTITGKDGKTINTFEAAVSVATRHTETVLKVALEERR